ncbi:MAG: carboxypeptidase regulatory-like domain-containing protein [Acidobacteria bacterium]|nr:carboxypeptidase regulatory-like domain-containing protein [Acidobacteriota bacterium]
MRTFVSLLVLSICGSVSPAWGQSATTGALTGTVRGRDGAPVPNASVAATDPATSQLHSTTTGPDGGYRLSLLPPAAYEVRFSASGFKTSVKTDAAVNISEAATLDATLEPGEGNEPIPCDCKFSVTTSASGTLIDSKTITAVPLTTRNFTQVLSMSSGSAADVNNAGTLGRGTKGLNVNGNTNGGSYTVDGAFAPSAAPNPDTIAELKIQTSQYDAVYGAQAPSTALITKSGQNDFHGGLWEFVRNDVFNANAFFRNSTGQTKPNLKQNQFGATVGGPILRNKVFFFGSYQGTQQVNGLDTTSTSNPILPALGADRSAAALAAQFCPANHPGDSRYASFAGGRQLDCHNQNTSTTASINPVALQILNLKRPDGSYYVPIPQTLFASGDNAGLGFSSYSLPSTYKEHHYMLNGDYLISPKHSLGTRAYVATIKQYRTFGSPLGYPGNPELPDYGTAQALTAHDLIASVNLTSTLTKTLTNEARVSFTRSTQGARGVGYPTATSIGMTPADPLFNTPPEMNIFGPLGNFRLFGNSGNDFTTANKYLSAADNFSWVHGKHNIRTGMFLMRLSNARLDTGTARGKMSFQTFSDFLLGLDAADNLSPLGRSNVQSIQANEGVGPVGEVQYGYLSHYGAGFVQDDFKILPRLTLNLGLRWEYVGAASDTFGTIGNVLQSLLLKNPIPPASGTLVGNTVAANYNASLINPYTGKAFGAPPTGVTVQPNNSFYQNSTPLDTFAPRFGFAWQPFGKEGFLAVRGGYGWFYQPPTYSANASGIPMFTAPPFAQGFTNADTSNNLSTFQQPYPATTLGYVPRTLTSQLSDRVAGPDFVIPRLQQWNLSTQFRLAKSLTFDIGYVGTHASRLLLSRGLNQPVLASVSSPVNCGYDGVATDCITTNTSKNAKYRVPVLGETPTALGDNEFTGASTYNSLQATLRRQSHGLAFQATYTYSRASSNTTTYNDLTNMALNWARTSFDRTHRLTTNLDYQVPAPAGLQGFRGALAKGWSVAGIIIIQSGLPMTLSDPSAGAVYGKASTATVTLCPNSTYESLNTKGGITDRLNGWINTAAICSAAAVGSDGATGYGTTGQSIMSGPGQFNTDFSIGKRTHVGGLREDGELAFRMELYNALNHPQFANPGTTLGTATFGVITQPSVAPRLIQFAMKYVF